MRSPQSSLDEALPLAAAGPEFTGKLGRDDRVLVDRRNRPTPMISRYTFFGGRRKSAGNRIGDDPAIFVDIHGAVLFIVVTAIIALNFFDAFFTILFLSYGGQELNPVMDMLLQSGTWPFIIAKSIGIGLCVLVLTVTKNFRIAKIGTGVVLAGYSVLLCWHLFLLQRLPL